MRTKIRAYKKTLEIIRNFTNYLQRFFIVLKGGAMEEFTKELLDQLNVDTAFTIGPFAISELVYTCFTFCLVNSRAKSS